MSRWQETATALAEAADARRTVPQVSAAWPDLTVADAYRVQALLRQRAGEDDIVGWKMGLTSHAKMRQMNVHDPIFGFLTRSMVVADGATVPASRFCQPRVEAELAVVLRQPLRWPCTSAQAQEAVGGVCLAIEILDSRYRDFRFSLPDVIADNTSASGFVCGPVVRTPGEIPWENLGVVLEIDGAPMAIASSAAVLGHPLRSLVGLVDLMNRYGEDVRTLPAGTVVLTGGITEAFPVAEGQRVRLRGDGLGEVSFRMGPRVASAPPPVYGPPT